MTLIIKIKSIRGMGYFDHTKHLLVTRGGVVTFWIPFIDCSTQNTKLNEILNNIKLLQTDHIWLRFEVF